MKTIFEVEIKDINVDEDYYDFQYQVKRNGIIVGKGEISDEHSWGDSEDGLSSFAELLKQSSAADLAIEKVIR